MQFDRREQDDQLAAGEGVSFVEDEQPRHEPEVAVQPTGPGDHSALLPWMDDLGHEVKHIADRGKELADKGVSWGGPDANFSGRADKKGVDATEKLGEHDQLHGHVGTNKSATLDWDHDGKTEAELYGSYHNKNQYELGARRTWDLDDGAKLTTGLRQQGTSLGAIDDAYASYRHGGTALDANAGVGNGQFVGGISGSQQLAPNESVSGSLTRDAAGTTALSAGYHEGSTNLGANLSHGPSGDAMSLSASSQLSPELSVAGTAGLSRDPTGAREGTLGIAERYRSGQVVQGLDVNAGVGTRNYLSARGSVDAQLAPNVYGGAWGSVNTEAGQRTSGQLGGSLTLTPSEKTALTFAGAVNERGGYEARAELDLLKKGYSNAGDLADRRKDAPLSLYVGYSKGGQQTMLDERYGAGQLSGREGVISGGVKVRF